MRLGIDLGLGSAVGLVRPDGSPIARPASLVAIPVVGAPALVSISGVTPFGLVATPTVGAPTVEEQPSTNLIANSTFDDATGWSNSGVSPNWTVSGGVATKASGSTVRFGYTLSPALVTGRSYRLTYTVSGRTNGTVNGRLRNPTDNNYTPRSSNGTFQETIVATGNHGEFALVPNSFFDGSVDNVILEDVT